MHCNAFLRAVPSRIMKRPVPRRRHAGLPRSKPINQFERFSRDALADSDNFTQSSYYLIIASALNAARDRV